MKKNEAAVLVRGLGMAMSFLQALTEEIVAAGGFEEMIHYLSTDAARPLCKKIATLVTASDWRIPRSLVERLSFEASREEGNDAESVEWDSKFRWCLVLDRLGVPQVKFGAPNYHPSWQPVPAELIEQLHGIAIRYPMIVTWDGESHVIVNQCGGNSWQEGCIFDASGEDIIALCLAPAKYFDLKR